MRLSYDLHNHILPGVDDGAKNSEESLTLIRALSRQGIKNICLTPHFYTHKESMDEFLRRRRIAAESFLPLVPEDIRVKLGAEVYITKYLFAEEKDLMPLCIEGTNYMLTEFPYTSRFRDGSMRLLNRLRDIGINPVLPHVERYPNLMKDTDLLEELIYMGVIIQSNAVSFTDVRFRRKLLKLLRNGYIQVLSSDAHSMERNSPTAISEALAVIMKKCGGEVISSLERNAVEVFEG